MIPLIASEVERVVPDALVGPPAPHALLNPNSALGTTRSTSS
jgi:hypothetical protein